MIQNVFTLDRPLVIFDLETTGTDVSVARIVEFAFRVFAPDGTMKEWRSLIDPEIQIPEDSIRVHHITNDDMRLCSKCGKAPSDHPEDHPFVTVPTFGQIAPRISKGFSDCDFAGKNIRFDLNVLLAEMARVRVPWSTTGARIICADRIEQLGEPRDLSSLYKRRTGKDMENAHSAMADVDATIEILVAQFELFAHLPRNLTALHELQWPGWVDSEGKFRKRNGEVVCTFGKHRNVSIRKIPSGYWQWLLKSDFSEELKAIANDALRGQFPS